MSGSRTTGNPCGNRADLVDRTTTRLEGWLSTRTAVVLQIIVIYLALGIGWLFVAHWVWQGTSEILVDFLCILISAVPLFFLIDHSLATVRAKETELRETWERTTRILEANPCGVILVDREGRVEYANPESAKILGAERNDLVGASYFGHPLEVTRVDGAPYPPEERPAWRAIKRGEAICDAQLTVRRPDGARVVLSLNAVPLRDEAGTSAVAVVSFFDITDRKKAHDLDMCKLSLAVAQSPIATMITDRKGVVEYVNPSYTRMTGYEAREVLGTRAVSCGGSVLGIFSQGAAGAGGDAERREVLQGKRKSGEPFWESVSISPIRSGDDAVSHFLWIREDITERRRDEEALREGREKFQSLVENIGDLVWEFDPDLAFTYVSPQARDILGLDPEKALGKTPFESMPPFEAQRVREIAAPIIAGRLPFRQLECVFRHRDGGSVVLATTGTPIFDADGTFRGWRGVSRDITERRRVEDVLRAKEEHFREMFEQSEDPTIIFEPGSARVRDANPAAIGLFGYSKGELAERGLALLTDPETCRELERRIGAIDDGHKLALDMVPHVRKGGERIIVSIRGKSIRLLKGGRFTRCTFRDITARVRMEEEAKFQQAQLIHANRMASLGRIVSGVAHEINNPNNLIMFNAPMVGAAWKDVCRILDECRGDRGDFLLEGLPYSEMRDIVPKLIAGVSDASQRIKAIVGNLKSFARRDAQGLAGRFDVNDVIRTTIAILNHEIHKGCADFSVETADRLPPVKGSAQQMEQVMVNLIMNALQALPDKKRGIRVSTSAAPDGDAVEIRVEDEGRGMTPEVLGRLTEPFFTTRSEEGGLGLGLSISLSIVKAHRGALTFRSEVGRGTAALVTLPAAEEAVCPGAAAVASGESP